jgi:hypothetical protein
MVVPTPDRVERMRGDPGDVPASRGADQVEMVDRHVDQERELHRVAEAAGELGGEVEVEVAAAQRPGRLFADELSQLLHRRGEAVVLRDDELPPGVGGKLRHQFRVLQVVGERFLGHEVQPALEREFRVLDVNRGRRDSQHRVGLDLLQRLAQVVKSPLRRQLQLVGGLVQRLGIRVDDGDDVEIG